MLPRTLLLALTVTAMLAGRRFYDDDPIRREPRPMSLTREPIGRKLSDYYDFFRNTLATPGELQRKGHIIRAQAVNTLGEVPDSAWYTNRHATRPMTTAELVRGSGGARPPSPEGKWRVIAAKAEGVTPGFEIVDSRDTRYLLKFDPLAHREIATAADVISSKFFYALGYNVPENYVVRFRREQLELAPETMMTDQLGRRRTMTDMDLSEILLNVPRDHDRGYRATASLRLSGVWLGPFRYHGTRRDDPNDVVPHEHRRDLRGLSVFCAWLAHDDSRSINTLDMLAEEDGVRFVKHHLIDFGSTLGSASYGANSPRSGFEYVFSWKPAIVQFFTFGLVVPSWARAHFPNLPSVGRFEADKFDAAGWVAEYPNPAFSNRLPDDAFWAAKQVMAFTDEQIRAIVKTGEYSDPAAENWVAQCLIQRRDKIGRAFFAGVLPLDRFEVRDGRLAFEDLGAKHGFAQPREYSVQWSRFDNESEKKDALARATSLALPREALAARPGAYFCAEIRGGDAKKTVTVYIRKTSSAFEVVGIGRTW